MMHVFKLYSSFRLLRD